MVKHMVEEYSIILITINLKGNSKRIRLMDLEFILILMVDFIKDNGKRIINMVMELKCIKMELNIKGSLLMASAKVRED